MSSLQQVMDGIASTVTSATSLRCFSYVPEDINPPTLILEIEHIERGAFSRGQFDLNIQGILLLDRASDRASQKNRHSYASWDSVSSVWKAIDTTPGVGLNDTNLAVVGYESMGFIEVGSYHYLAGKFTIIGQTVGA